MKVFRIIASACLSTPLVVWLQPSGAAAFSIGCIAYILVDVWANSNGWPK